MLELLLDLNATEEQFDSPTIFCSAREGTSSYGPDDKGTDLIPLFETIVNYIDPPKGDANGPLQVLVSSIDYNEFVGRMGIGRIERGTIHQNQEVIVCDYHDPSVKKKERLSPCTSLPALAAAPSSRHLPARSSPSPAFPISPSAARSAIWKPSSRCRSSRSLTRPSK